jgi:hypothetical protein
VIGLKQIRCVDLVSRFPCIVTFRVSFPFDEILELSRPSMTSVVEDTLHFVFFFSADKVRWRPGEVWSIGGRFLIG